MLIQLRFNGNLLRENGGNECWIISFLLTQMLKINLLRKIRAKTSIRQEATLNVDRCNSFIYQHISSRLDMKCTWNPKSLIAIWKLSAQSRICMQVSGDVIDLHEPKHRCKFAQFVYAPAFGRLDEIHKTHFPHSLRLI